MIHFEITETPDLNVKTAFKYFQNQVYLGKKHGDLLIHDSLVQPSHLMLEVFETELLVHPQSGVEFFLLNGKRATHIRKIRIGDTVTFGKTTLKILGFELTQFKTRKTVLNEKLNHLIETGSPRVSVIEEVTKLMK